MEPNLRDTPLRRFNTFFWGIGLFVVFAITAVIVKNVVADDAVDLESENAKPRVVRYKKITAEQNAERNTYQDNGDGTVQVKPEDVFGLGKQIGLLDAPKASEMKHNKSFN